MNVLKKKGKLEAATGWFTVQIRVFLWGTKWEIEMVLKCTFKLPPFPNDADAKNFEHCQVE